MSAKKGSTFRLVAMCATAIIAVLAIGASSAFAMSEHKTYIAIGDSLAFGYSQNVYNSKMAEGDPASAFEAGYVDDYYAKLKGHSVTTKVNLGCPGETSASLIGNGPLAAALEGSFGATGEAPCAYQEAWNAFHTPGVGGPLHVPYVGKSQAEKAIEEVAVAAGSGRPVSRVTINIGANDELHQVGKCEAEVKHEFETEGKSKYGATPAEAGHNCIVAHVPTLIKTIITNTEAVAYAIRHGKEFGGVDYSGPITFMASYDPYGVVFRAGEDGFGTGKELLEGSIGLAGLINGEEAGHFKQKFNPPGETGFEGCTANALSTFNPQTRTEPSKLQMWTNMANFTPFQYGPEPSEVLTYGQKVESPLGSGRVLSANGPDIHPTAAGYMKLANIIKKACGN